MARTPTTHEGRLTHTIRLMSVKYAVDGSKATLQFTVIYVSVKVHAYSHTSRGVSSRAVSAVARLPYFIQSVAGTNLARTISELGLDAHRGRSPRARARGALPLAAGRARRAV